MRVWPRFQVLFIVLLGTALAAGISAQAAPPYLPSDAIDPSRLLAAPPSVESGEAKTELGLILWLQEHRTREQEARCQAEARLDMSAFRSVLGPWFTADNLPAMDTLFKHLDQESRRFSTPVKKHFGRQRPYVVDKRVKPATEPEATPSYPSGHATRGILLATILSEIAPEQKTALMERGREIGWDRVIAGIHYPSDVFAGRTLGNALAKLLLVNPEFKAELAKVGTEFEAVKRKQSQPAGVAP